VPQRTTALPPADDTTWSAVGLVLAAPPGVGVCTGGGTGGEVLRAAGDDGVPVGPALGTAALHGTAWRAGPVSRRSLIFDSASSPMLTDSAAPAAQATTATIVRRATEDIEIGIHPRISQVSIRPG
jgi:hypothetical protein